MGCHSQTSIFHCPSQCSRSLDWGRSWKAGGGRSVSQLPRPLPPVLSRWPGLLVGRLPSALGSSTVVSFVCLASVVTLRSAGPWAGVIVAQGYIFVRASFRCFKSGLSGLFRPRDVLTSNRASGRTRSSLLTCSPHDGPYSLDPVRPSQSVSRASAFAGFRGLLSALTLRWVGLRERRLPAFM